jgi:hypothetical protein
LAGTLDGDAFMGILFLSLAAAVGTVIAVTAIITTQARRYREVKLALELKRDLIERGVPIEQIERIVGPILSHSARGEVVVEQGGEWYPATVLNARAGLYYIHYEGYGQDEDEWVEEERVRFPARYLRDTVSGQDDARGGRSPVVAASDNGMPAKCAPLDSDL